MTRMMSCPGDYLLFASDPHDQDAIINGILHHEPSPSPSFLCLSASASSLMSFFLPAGVQAALYAVVDPAVGRRLGGAAHSGRPTVVRGVDTVAQGGGQGALPEDWTGQWRGS